MATRHTPAKLRPLSAEAQELARQNIRTVAGFLAHHRLSDDWYDVVISATCSRSRTGWTARSCIGTRSAR